MKLLVVLAHPDPASFNAALARRAVAALQDMGHEVIFRDLYRAGFDGVLPKEEIPAGAVLPETLRQECDHLASADGIVIVHPNWWGQPPAILKGWIDRVVRPGVAYRFEEQDSGEGVPVGLLKARAAVVFNTSNTDPDREAAVFGDPLERIWKDCIFALCGIKSVYRRTFGVIVTSSKEERVRWLDEAALLLAETFPSHDRRAAATPPPNVDTLVSRGTMPQKGTIFQNIPVDLPQELVSELLPGKGFRIERIVSKGHASPPEFWYDQDDHEWVLLLKGRAILEVMGEDARHLSPGDYCFLPAHRRHRIPWTAPEEETIWLAVHLPASQTGCGAWFPRIFSDNK